MYFGAADDLRGGRVILWCLGELEKGVLVGVPHGLNDLAQGVCIGLDPFHLGRTAR